MAHGPRPGQRPEPRTDAKQTPQLPLWHAKAELHSWARELLEERGWRQIRTGIAVKLGSGPEGRENEEGADPTALTEVASMLRTNVAPPDPGVLRLTSVQVPGAEGEMAESRDSTSSAFPRSPRNGGVRRLPALGRCVEGGSRGR